MARRELWFTIIGPESETGIPPGAYNLNFLRRNQVAKSIIPIIQTHKTRVNAREGGHRPITRPDGTARSE